MKIVNRRKLFERVHRKVQIEGSGGAGSRGQILRFGRRPDSDGFAIKSMIKTGPFWSPEGSGAIWAVSGAVQKGAGTIRFRDVRLVQKFYLHFKPKTRIQVLDVTNQKSKVYPNLWTLTS